MNSEVVFSTNFNTAIALETVEFIKDFDCNKTSRIHYDDRIINLQQFDKLLSMFDEIDSEFELQYIENKELKFFSIAQTKEILQILKSELLQRKRDFVGF